MCGGSDAAQGRHATSEHAHLGEPHDMSALGRRQTAVAANAAGCALRRPTAKKSGPREDNGAHGRGRRDAYILPVPGQKLAASSRLAQVAAPPPSWCDRTAVCAAVGASGAGARCGTAPPYAMTDAWVAHAWWPTWSVSDGGTRHIDVATAGHEQTTAPVFKASGENTAKRRLGGTSTHC